MTIRSRLALWYAGLTLVSLGSLAYGLYVELVIEPKQLAAEGKRSDTPKEEISEILLWYTLPAAVVAVMAGWWMTRRLLAPISRLTETAEGITLDNLDQRLPQRSSNDEFARLTEVFNNMLSRLEASVAQIRDFTMHASHELKTPLTIMRGEMEAALDQGEITPAQRELFGSQLDEIHRLTKIVEGLTLLAKADAGQLVLNETTVPLHELVRDSFVDAQILAQTNEIQVTLPRCDEVFLKGDRHRLRQLLLNLTDNAIKYNCPGGHVEIQLQREQTLARLSITNSGPGIAPEVLPRVFDRFFRGHTSQSPVIDGCGLGLAIADWIVRAHVGTIEIDSALESPTTVRVEFPLHTRERTATTRLLKPLPQGRIRLAAARKVPA